MNKTVPIPIIIAAVAVVLLGVAAGIWHGLKPAPQPPPASATNIAHGIPPPMSLRSNAYHGPQ